MTLRTNCLSEPPTGALDWQVVFHLLKDFPSLPNYKDANNLHKIFWNTGLHSDNKQNYWPHGISCIWWVGCPCSLTMIYYMVWINIRDVYRWAQPNLSFLYFQEQRQISDHKILRNYPNWRAQRHWTTWGSKTHLLSHEIPYPCETGERKYGFPPSTSFPVKNQGKELKPFSQYNPKKSKLAC